MVEMKKYIKLVCFVAVLFLFTACPFIDPDTTDTDFKIVNNSDKNILFTFYFQNNETIDSDKFSPWGNDFEEVKKMRSYIKAHSTYSDRFDSYIIKKHLKTSWIKYYLFDFDSVSTISWERIRDERIILKEVTFNSWEEMEACNFTITYP